MVFDIPQLHCDILFTTLLFIYTSNILSCRSQLHCIMQYDVMHHQSMK
jgi:hypothetical protein